MRTHLASLVEDWRRHGNATAIVTYTGNRRVATSYAGLALLADRFSAELRRRGVSAGERVVLWGANGAEWMGAFFGCLLRGVIAVPLDTAGAVDFARRVMAETAPRLIVGDATLLAQLDGERLAFESFSEELPQVSTPEQPDPSLNPDTPLQILFTSGTTAEPKGVVHTHRNIAASVAPIEREIGKYLKYEKWVHPLRFLHTLPLSHVFGQFMALWIPPLLAAEVHFESRLQAGRLMETARRERISVLAAVPRVLELLREALLAEWPELERELSAAQGEKVWKRWWRFRRIHRKLGYKFWAFVCGGASLPSDLEQFWNTLGFALVQGYGMTETAALISLNHPFKVGKGTMGKVLPGRDVEIGEDGEVRVRGDMVSTSTWRNGRLEQAESPWLATGDLAQRDEAGQLRFLGRKNQMIVTASGLNLHPEDVERALDAQAGVQASVVVAQNTSRGPEPVAVLLLRGTREDAERAVSAANAGLAEFQRVRRWRLWPELDFPRTATGKIRRGKVAEWVNNTAKEENATETVTNSDALLAVIAGITGIRPARQDESARLADDLGLDSLGRVQLQAELEQRFGLGLGEQELEQVGTLGELRRLLGVGAGSAVVHEEASSTATAFTPAPAVPQGERDIYPHWPWSAPARWGRTFFMELVLRPLVWLLAAPVVRREGAVDTSQSLLLIANHVSTYDMPLILYALPGRMRRRVAAAMAANMLEDWRKSRNQGSWFLNVLGPLTYLTVTAVFNVFPLPRSAGFRRSFAHAGEALDRGFHVLVFPEGHRSDGTLQRFRPGIGLLVEESKTAVLPIALAGLGAMKTGRERWFRSGKLRVMVGEPMRFEAGLTAEEITERLHAEIERLLKKP
ncbi:AMP-binding protein [Silvibacterium dinghuense]|uniref:AMP-binding protein n=2 Tax=Silvibacterium dinghuense TaxID=1560006 RepID=A0A4Q1SKD0_9BACT|nr:AMP-binding protein [Silvibacterium dinghuense]